MKAISKQSVTEQHMADLDRFVEIANTLLSNSTSLPFYVSHSRLAVPTHLRPAFMDRFTSEGWDVALNFDQRDGDYWCFK